MTTPEFSRPERLDTIGPGERSVAFAADPDECAALAGRFGLIAVAALNAALSVRREAAGIRVRGRVSATVAQACSVTGEPLPVRVDAPLDVLFVAEEQAPSDEVELDEASCDIVFHDGQTVDLGEAAAETLALALDPFPRGPGADAALKAAGVLGEGEAGPFGALAALLRK
ncbi:MAG: YceD family protein [Pseudomonadota bacterium]